MVISSSNVNMTSSRNYTRSVQFQNAAFQWTLDGRRMRADSYTSSASHEENAHYSGSDNYNNFARLTADPKHFMALHSKSETSAVTTLRTGNPADNVMAQHETLRVTFLDLLDMIRAARFKKMVEGSGAYHRFFFTDPAGSYYPTRSSTILSLTSNSSPTVWNRIQTTSYFMEETETTAFCTKGTVCTADGRSLDFNVSFEMSRHFTESQEYSEFSQYQQILTDPLIINLDASPTAITDKKFFFDLDCDGKAEEIAQLATGHGYLALDRNGDGKINDGSELFGPRTGNGFQDLSAYDQDGNGWIDEKDAIYGQLKVWTKSEDGRDVLLSLKDADVGAICLTSSQTPFDLKGDDQTVQGKVRTSGIYLKENGEARTLQQVDF